LLNFKLKFKIVFPFFNPPLKTSYYGSHAISFGFLFKIILCQTVFSNNSVIYYYLFFENQTINPNFKECHFCAFSDVIFPKKNNQNMLTNFTYSFVVFIINS
jgi:hypothetical protein